MLILISILVKLHTFNLACHFLEMAFGTPNIKDMQTQIWFSVYNFLRPVQGPS